MLGCPETFYYPFMEKIISDIIPSPIKFKLFETNDTKTISGQNYKKGAVISSVNPNQTSILFSSQNPLIGVTAFHGFYFLVCILLLVGINKVISVPKFGNRKFY